MASWGKAPKGYLRIGFYLLGKREHEMMAAVQREWRGARDTREERRTREGWKRDLEHALSHPESFKYGDWFPFSQRLARKGGVVAVTEVAPLTLGDYARRWLAGRRTISDAERKAIEGRWARYLDRTSLGILPPAVVTRWDIQAVCDGKPFVDASKFLQRLRRIFKELQGDGIVGGNPAAFVELKRPEDDFKEPIEPFTPAEQIRIVNAAGLQDRSMIGLGFATGVRPSELLRIQYRDIDFARRKLFVRGTKTKGARRYIELSAAALAMLEVWATPKLGPIFLTERGRPMSLNNWRRRNWTPILKAAGVEHRGPNNMRHSYAVDRIDEGYSKRWIAEKLGHSSGAMIDKHYGRWLVPREARGGE